MIPPRHAWIVTLAAAVSCAAPPPAPPVAPAPLEVPPPAAALATPCDALSQPLTTLRELAALVALGRSMPIRPRVPERFAARLAADAAQARGVAPGGGELGKLASGAAARLDRISAATRVLAGKRSPDEAEAARTTLLEEMERGEIFVEQGVALCHAGEGLAGRLSAAAIQRVVRGGFGAFRACYEPALRRDPSLRGTVRVRFVVARDGSVSEASDEGRAPPSPLAWSLGEADEPLRDPEVSACVVAAFKKLTFPRPTGGTFGATYPIELGRR